MKKIAHVICQFDSLRILKDGGGKITLEFGADSLESIQKIQSWVSSGDMNLAVAITPLDSRVEDEIENLEY